MTNVVSLGPWLHVIRRDAMDDSQEVFVRSTQLLCLKNGFIFVCNIKKFHFPPLQAFSRTAKSPNSTIDADSPIPSGSVLAPTIQR